MHFIKSPCIKSNSKIVMLITILAISIFALSVQAWCDDVKEEMSNAINAVKPALIRIRVISADYREGQQKRSEASGSGVIITPDGYAVTNHHVADQAELLMVTLADKTEVEAKLIGTDPLADIAVIKLIPKNNKPFPFAKFADSSNVLVGDRVYAMGSPFAISQSVTMGIVSNTEMILPDIMFMGSLTLDGEDVGSIVRWIGHDALIEPGNSGGPLVNKDGGIVGINEISIGLSGAIPSNLAKNVSDQLIKHGKVIRGWLGFFVQPLIESSVNKEGALVSAVLPDSPAEKAQIKPGDIILSVDGNPFTVRFKEQVPLFNQMISSLPVGKTIKIKLLRDGVEKSIDIVVAERPKANADQSEIRGWGITATDITFMIEKQKSLKNRDGVIITGTRPSGAASAAKPELRRDDIIKSINKEPVKNVAEFKAATKKILDANKEDKVSVLVGYERSGKQYITVVKLGKEEQSNSGIEVKKAWIPVDIQVITDDIAEALGMKGKNGVRITQIFPGGEKSGLEVGDLVIKLDGESIPAEQIGDEDVFNSMVRQYDIGSEVTLGVIRDNKPIDVKVKLAAAPKPTRDYPRYENENFQFTSRDLSYTDKTATNLKNVKSGVVVDSVVEGGWTAIAGLKTGDVIESIDGVPISNLESLKAKLVTIEKAKPKTVVFKVKQGILGSFLEIKPIWSEIQ